MKIQKIVVLALALIIVSPAWGINYLPSWMSPAWYAEKIGEKILNNVVNKQAAPGGVLAPGGALIRALQELDPLKRLKFSGAISGAFGMCAGLGWWYYRHKITKKCSHKQASREGMGVAAVSLFGGLMYWLGGYHAAQ